MRVLLAEPETASRPALRATLAQWGYEVMETRGGRETVQVLQSEEAPKLALLDRHLPEIDGIEVCQQVRQQMGPPYIYIIILAAEENQQDVIDCLNAGADEYLVRSADSLPLRAHLNAAQRILDLQDELIAAREALREQATRDSLTRLWNHGAILDILKRELERSQRIGTPVGVLMADLDHFKGVNDTHGHRAGDQVLCQVARQLESALRPYDSIGRYGGEEFLIILPGCDTASALVLGERLRRSVSGKAMLVSQCRIPLSISLGACSNRETYVADMETLLRASDTALYRAKNNGRNRVERAQAADVVGRLSG